MTSLGHRHLHPPAPADSLLLMTEHPGQRAGRRRTVGTVQDVVTRTRARLQRRVSNLVNGRSAVRIRSPAPSQRRNAKACGQAGGEGLGQRTLAGLVQALKRDRTPAAPTNDPQEAFRLGASLGQQGDVEGARSAYQQAIDSGDAEHAPAAGFQLGLLLGQHDDIDGAREAYRLAANSGHPEYGPAAARNLGHLYKRQGRYRQACAAYQAAIDSGHADVAPWAMLYLGNLLDYLRNPADARASYQRAVDSGHPKAGPRAARRLADMP